MMYPGGPDMAFTVTPFPDKLVCVESELQCRNGQRHLAPEVPHFHHSCYDWTMQNMLNDIYPGIKLWFPWLQHTTLCPLRALILLWMSSGPSLGSNAFTAVASSCMQSWAYISTYVECSEVSESNSYLLGLERKTCLMMSKKSYLSGWKPGVASITQALCEHWGDFLWFSSNRWTEIALSVCILGFFHFGSNWGMNLKAVASRTCAWSTKSRRFLLSFSKAGLTVAVFLSKRQQHSGLQKKFQTADDKTAAWVSAVTGLSFSTVGLYQVSWVLNCKPRLRYIKRIYESPEWTISYLSEDTWAYRHCRITADFSVL